MEEREVVLVSGMSGAGKTQAMAVFENLRYYCIDNYPAPLLQAFSEYLRTPAFTDEKVALAVPIQEAIEAIRILSNIDWINLHVLFLDCEDSILLKRYKETRRSHPLMIHKQASTLLEAIQIERKTFDQIRSQANSIVDTTLLKPKRLGDAIASAFSQKEEMFRVSFVSFGYKFGIPKDADLVLDVRFLPNPFYIESLRKKTGNDIEVYSYVMEKEETKEFVKRTIEYFDYLLENYEKEGKMQVIVAIGCTGGQHRSVTLTNYLAEHYSSIYHVYKWHRDADH